MIIDQPVVSGSFFVTGSSTFVGNIVVTGSISATEGIVVSGSIASASYAANAEKLDGLDSTAFVLTSSYNPVSSSLASRITVVETTYATTGSNIFTSNQTICGNLTTTGTITAQTLNVQQVTSSIVYSSGSNIFGNQLTDTQQLTGSVTVTGSLSVNNSLVLTQNQTGSITVLSSSYALTASYVENAQSSSIAVSSSYALSASYAANVPNTASYALQALSSSYAVSSSQSVSSSYSLTASYAANVPATASYALEALSSSYALTASYSANVPVTSSYALQALSASYAQTSSYSLSGTGFPFSGSAVITGSLLITNLSGSGIRYVVADENGLMTAQTASTVLKTTQTYTASAGQTTFSVTNGYSTGYVDVFINGSKLNDSEFTDTSGTDVLLLTASFDNDIVEVVKYLPAQGVSNNVLRTLTTFTAANSQSTYNVSYTPGLLDIFYNGSRLSPVEFTANNGTSFTLATASAEGDTLDVLVYSYQVGAYAGIGGSGQLNQVSFYTTTSSISGSNNFTFDGSTLRVTGSIITSGSSTFVNIGPTILSGSVAISGSLTVTQGVTISGSIASASYASNAELLDNLDSTAFVFTSSFNTYSSSMSTRTSNLESTASVLTSASASLNTASGSFSTRVTRIEGNYATTGSNVFMGAQTVCANITSTGTIIAQTLNVQQVTSSIVYSSGSNIFGCSLSNTQQFTGSVLMTGSLTVTTAGTSPEFQVVTGGTIKGNALTDVHNVTGSLRITGSVTTTGPLGGRYATFNAPTNGGYVTFEAGGTAFGDIGSYCAQYGTCDATTLLLGTRSGYSLVLGTSSTERFRIASNGVACFACDLTAKTIGTNDLILNNLNYECANYVDGTRGSWLIQEGACDLFIINQVSGKKYKFNLIEIK